MPINIVTVIGPTPPGTGVIAEAFGLLEKEYRERIAVLIIDTMSVFHSLKCPNTNVAEVERLHCNAGALATAGYGTALGVVRAAWEAGKQIKVLADETREV